MLIGLPQEQQAYGLRGGCPDTYRDASRGCTRDERTECAIPGIEIIQHAGRLYAGRISQPAVAILHRYEQLPGQKVVHVRRSPCGWKSKRSIA